jgi:N-acetylmuramic acid 6-phosphate etherase
MTQTYRRDTRLTISLNQIVSENSRQKSAQFLKISAQFKLGALVTEASHAVTANLSEVAKLDISAALNLLFEADDDVLRKFREVAASGALSKIAAEVLATVRNGGRIFFTGCGSTGRLSILLDSVWRDFWRRRGGATGASRDYEERTFSVMAGGDYALIKSVEGFEDFTAFGRKQMADLGVSSRDLVFAITEGGETSFVIGTAWEGVDVGAKVYFVYNNPDDILCAHVQRSREVIQDGRIQKLNLTTGPMAITGSTRMQATSIQLCVMLTVLEMVARELIGLHSGGVPEQFCGGLTELLAQLKLPEFCAGLALFVALEEQVYRGGHKNNYYADHLGIDVLTDTTERSPTYCTPPFRKWDDATAAESWAFLFLPEEDTQRAWERILQRKPRCIDWNDAEIRALVDEDKVARTREIVAKIGPAELMRYKIDAGGLRHRQSGPLDGAIGILAGMEVGVQMEFIRSQLALARRKGAKTGLIMVAGPPETLAGLESSVDYALRVGVPPGDWLLDGLTRVAVKLVMNALSTCTMVRLGRVMGNFMVWVVPSNLKLIDRATRYITKLTELNYEAANELLFEIIEYVEPRMKSDQAYPPVVGMAVLRAREKLTNEQAETKLMAGPG